MPVSQCVAHDDIRGHTPSCRTPDCGGWRGGATLQCKLSRRAVSAQTVSALSRHTTPPLHPNPLLVSLPRCVAAGRGVSLLRTETLLSLYDNSRFCPVQPPHTLTFSGDLLWL